MISKSQFTDKFEKIFSGNNLGEFITPEIVEKMYRLTEYMLDTNEKMNLTAITDPEDVIAKHLADSALVGMHIAKNSKVCDVGCGGGFPSLPLAIIRPDLEIIGIDSTEKRIKYVNETAKQLNLTNITAIAGRAEDFSKLSEYREKFNICTARAVASLPILSELCIPFITTGGKFIAMKGKFSDDEFEAAKTSCKKLGTEELKEDNVHRFNLLTRTGCEERSMVILQKIAQTPTQYPRNYSQIKKKPL